MPHLRFLIVICSTIGLFGTGQPPVQAACTSLVPATPSPSPPLANNARNLLDLYRNIVKKNVDQATGRIETVIGQTNRKVKLLYAAAESQLLDTVGQALRDGCSNSSDAKHLHSVEIPVYIKRVNKAVEEAIDHIDHTVATVIADIRQHIGQVEADIVAGIETGTIDDAAQIIDGAAANVVAAIKRAESEVQRHFFWANLIVQAYISLTERRVRRAMAPSVAKRVSADILEASEHIDRVEKQAVADVEAALEQIRTAFGRLNEFLGVGGLRLA